MYSPADVASFVTMVIKIVLGGTSMAVVVTGLRSNSKLGEGVDSGTLPRILTEEMEALYWMCVVGKPVTTSNH